jgi:hypothetical protein
MIECYMTGKAALQSCVQWLAVDVLLLLHHDRAAVLWPTAACCWGHEAAMAEVR